MSAVLGVAECVDSVPCELERIADAMSGFDLDGFLTTLLATLIGAGVAAVVTLWLNRRERPRPVWRVEAEAGRDWHVRDGKVIFVASMTNIGDGMAYNVTIEMQGARQNGPPVREAVIEPGESLKIGFYVPASGEMRFDVHTGEYTDERAVEWPATAKLSAEWQQPPRRHRQRRATFALTSPLPAR